MVSVLLSQHFRSEVVKYPSAKCVSKTVAIRITVAVFFCVSDTKISPKSTLKITRMGILTITTKIIIARVSFVWSGLIRKLTNENADLPVWNSGFNLKSLQPVGIQEIIEENHLETPICRVQKYLRASVMTRKFKNPDPAIVIDLY